jgi:hypothetical protein
VSRISERSGSDVELTSELFELAVKNRHGDVRVVIPPERAEEFDWISHLLDVVDSQWEMSPADEQSVMSAFIQRVHNQLGEVWDGVCPVATLGDLIAARRDGLPAFSEDTLKQLRADSTPISCLKDPSTLTFAAGQAMRRAGVPKTFISEFLRWMRRVLQETTSTSSQSGVGYVVRPAA